jgi:hypothetical protein
VASDLTLAAVQQIERTIYVIRGQNVMLDADLAALYGVPTKVFLQSVRRHSGRFPDDFMFQLTKEEYDGLRSQIVTSNGRGGRRYRPFAFTEQGVAMLSSILNSPRAIQVNIEIMRTFVRLRRLLETNAELARRLNDLEQKYDAQFGVIFDTIRQLMAPPDPPRRRLGFPTLTQDDSPSLLNLWHEAQRRISRERAQSSGAALPLPHVIPIPFAALRACPEPAEGAGCASLQLPNVMPTVASLRAKRRDLDPLTARHTVRAGTDPEARHAAPLRHLPSRPVGRRTGCPRCIHSDTISTRTAGAPPLSNDEGRRRA